MSDLYRAGPSISDNDIELAGLLDDGILVNVEPDYEAAAIETGLWAINKELALNNAKQIVDAALGRLEDE